MTALLSLPFAPPPYSLDDNGTMFWPPMPHFIDWPEDWPHVAEAWDKYRDEGERRRARRLRDAIRCRTCGDEIQLRDARKHQLAKHVGEAIEFDWAHSLWVWQMLGFQETWWGKPTGWYTLIDPRTEKSKRWEADVLVLGTRAADELWIAS